MELDLRKANEIFHDTESRLYDDKWGIRYDSENAERVKKKLEKALGETFPRVGKLLEVGCGTGYVGLNLCSQPGLVGELNTCDISQGMVDVCRRNARGMGVEVKAKRSELEKLDYPDNEFDMVIGHAILHHVPDIARGLSEIHRVLVPGGTCLLAGEPTRVGDLMGQFARGATGRAVRWYARRGGYFGGLPVRLKCGKEGGAEDEEARELEKIVDVHTFRPARVCRIARSVGFSQVRYSSEEFLSSFVGWITRTIENNLDESNLTFRWRYWSYMTYLKLNDIDESLHRIIPSSWFYNMLLYLHKPGRELEAKG